MRNVAIAQTFHKANISFVNHFKVSGSLCCAFILYINRENKVCGG